MCVCILHFVFLIFSRKPHKKIWKRMEGAKQEAKVIIRFFISLVPK